MVLLLTGLHSEALAKSEEEIGDGFDLNLVKLRVLSGKRKDSSTKGTKGHEEEIRKEIRVRSYAVIGNISRSK